MEMKTDRKSGSAGMPRPISYAVFCLKKKKKKTKMLFSLRMIILFFFSWYSDHRYLHSFPTRRSSDLCSELRWAYCNHKATYFASYLTGGDCVPDDQN